MRWLLLVVVLTACGDNVAPWLLEELDPQTGFWVRTPEFAVPQGQEVQDCYFFKVPDVANGADLMVDRFALGLNVGSHHMNVFRVKTIVALDPAAGEPVDMGGVQGTVVHGGAPPSPCWKSSNWADWPIVANSQQSVSDRPILDWQLPTGVATRFTPGEMLMLQIHYVNATDQTTPAKGRGGINFYRSADGDTMELGTVFATQQSIRVCRSNPQPSYSGACALPAGTHTVTAANGHFHSRGREFRIWAWDGISTTQPADDALFYQNTDWNEPLMKTDIGMVLPQTGGIWWTCDYLWTEPDGGCAAVDARDPQHANDCCYTFGPTVETSEHCNVFAYYYPKVTTGDVTCF
ncbi:MAG: hypothetical protein JWO36_5476 [Myxococcales bacterium]|nr:hypothetical protein [Myxococcales bacterium]